jgi:Protein of unknown function (DUF1460)
MSSMVKILLILLYSSSVFAQTTDWQTILREKVKIPKGNTHSQTILAVAKSFVGTPYIAHTLEGNDSEQLICNLSGLDCVTFVESVLSLSHCIETGKPTTQAYKQYLQSLRYRNNAVNGYSSRIHYFSDWLLENQKNGKLQLITQEIGGIPYSKTINFMSAHRQLYPALSNESVYQQIVAAEKNLNKQKLCYIPKTDLAKHIHQIKEGDLVCLTSSKTDLDIAHQGFAIKQDGKLYLLHASSDHKKVMVSDVSLLEYVNRNKSQSGVMVGRIID